MNTINLSNLRDRAYQCACAHGFHDEELSDEHFLMLVITELAEAVEADRLGRHADKLGFETGISNAYHGVVRDGWFTYCYNRCIKGTVEEELSDAVIRLLDLAGLRGLEINFPEKWIGDMCSEYTGKSFAESIYAICNIHCRRKLLYGEAIGHIVKCTIASIFGLAERLDVDLAWHIEQKMKYNEFRGYKHGKLY